MRRASAGSRPRKAVHKPRKCSGDKDHFRVGKTGAKRPQEWALIRPDSLQDPSEGWWRTSSDAVESDRSGMNKEFANKEGLSLHVFGEEPLGGALGNVPRGAKPLIHPLLQWYLQTTFKVWSVISLGVSTENTSLGRSLVPGDVSYCLR